jgi:hypothetical protein
LALEPVVETLFSLALLFRTALVVTHERVDRGDFEPEPPPGLTGSGEPLPIAA